MKQKHIQHLYSRVGFGINYRDLDVLKPKSKKNIVSNLFSNSKKVVPLDIDVSEFEIFKSKSGKQLKLELGKEEVRELQKKSRKKVRELNYAWINRLSETDTILREKMTLFWANVFVCRDNHILHIQQYNNVLRENALGDFKSFVKAISKEPSMIKYLNLKQNVKKNPNENFARELMELFTLGVGNYKEQDIKESARAFTGYNFDKKGDFKLVEKKHDFESKTFFDKTGNFNGDAIIDIILEQKQCARFICKKVYTYFINPKIDENRLEEITNVFYEEYSITNLMHYIFSSNWFYEDKNIGVKIKSPIELLVGIQTTIPFTFEKEQRLLYLQKMMGQTLLYPVNVAGWKGDKNWIDSNTILFRMKLPAVLLNNAVINLEEKGDFEDSFEAYYTKNKGRNKYIKTEVNWDAFENEYGKLTPKELQHLVITSKLDADTQHLLDSLKIRSNKSFCIQLMSIPEYQLC
ncbi:DUF1800 domain-containing protein [Lacinutrix himadriensis]|uniref:DUF1800 domain-containing protein n=1 Tax=Lacinutrix himadriensis TaxID=641549 RepID=UPI0006E24D69|nr:DUF1800 domain-containing protein [Lacinutrix himadriensis]